MVIGTASGHIDVLDGRPGKDVPPFPFRAHGRVMAPVLLLDLHARKPNMLAAGGGGGRGRASDQVVHGLHLIVLGFDGYLYAIDGRTGCADVVDIGETS